MKVAVLSKDAVALTREMTQILPRRAVEDAKQKVLDDRQKAIDRHAEVVKRFDAQEAYWSGLLGILDEKTPADAPVELDDKALAVAFPTPLRPGAEA